MLTSANNSVPCRAKYLAAGVLLMLVSQASASTLFDDSAVLELDLTGPLSAVFARNGSVGRDLEERGVLF